MQNLIRFFLKYGNILLFVLLELFCLFLVVNQNQNQKNIFEYSKNIVSGYFFSQIKDFNDFLHLTEISDSLAVANAKLRSQLDQSKFSYNSTETFIQDSLYLQEYTYIAARVISNSIHLQNNRMIIDKGTDNGVTVGMGIVADKGVVGIVSEVNTKFSLVLPLLHSQSRISAALKRNKYFGSLVWSGRKSQDFKLTDVPKHADVRLGDTIITSGYSTVFPKGIVLGTVNQVQEIKGSNEYNIDTKINLDISNLDRVYVVKNLFREEFDHLLNPDQNE